MNERIRRSRSQPGVVRLDSIPDRGTQDIHGDNFDGLTRLKLKYRDLTNDELNTDAVDERVLKSGTVTDGHVAGKFGKGVLPGDIHYGKVVYGDIQNTPDLSKFVKDEQIAGLQNKKQVQNIVKDMVKKGSLK